MEAANAEKVARAIVAVWGSGSGHADLEKSITRALLTAHEAGRREGLEEAAKLAETGPDESYYSEDRKFYGTGIAKDIRALSERPK